ncbi:MAG: hypothetical protein ACI845_000525 [Gammaproteobacteria bacterium]|jgi:uncharacterized protein
MPLTEEIISNRYSISAYSKNSITINEVEYQKSLILAASQLELDWPVNQLELIEDQHLKQIMEFNPEVILLGTGERQKFPHPSIFAYFGEKGIGLEVMDTGALCRTFNILVAEDRAVVAAVIFD